MMNAIKPDSLREATPEEIDRMNLRIYPVPPSQDGSCPNIKRIAEMPHIPQLGYYRCLLRAEPSGGTNYEMCDCSHHENCPAYLGQQKNRAQKTEISHQA